ncbi:DUF3093 domain-containing protein [Sediminivirga luteola]|uniref:Membrane protein n=1 Tax=Sediminivirga luteola TaxID=1774748 RepID=A0A8J2XJS4_9MICO|nr:DUF3093 domain-containing protein [Sediminivirga luteola]MCI2266194.1 DUF3093 domain-containing protein [Sediminivirga luteola]GGA08222.1 membrane protein [Sediminivirga luteola]
MPKETTRTPVYRERLWPSAWIALLGAAIAALSALMAVPIGAGPAIAAGGAAAIVTALVLLRSAATVSVTDAELRAGAAHIELRHISAAEPLSGDQAREALGPGLDARAFLLTRPWVRSLVRVYLDDPADPTPYWLLSSRRPQELAAALGRPAR